MKALKPAMRRALMLLYLGACLPDIAMAQAQRPERFDGASAPTGTQGTVGNPNCPPPLMHTRDGMPYTPLNWSCDSSGYWPSQSPYAGGPVEVHHPGPMDPSDPNNPCLVQGHNYDWRNNPPGTYLPAGCQRPSNGGVRTVYPPSRGQYQPINRRFQAPAPAAPGEQSDYPGKFLQPNGLPGDYLQPSGFPGDYLGPNGEPLPTGQENYRRPEVPPGQMPPEIYIQRIPQMPFGRLAPRR